MKRHYPRLVRAAVFLGFLCGAIAPGLPLGVAAGGSPRSGGVIGETPAPSGRIVLKFTDASGLHVAGGRLQPPSPQATRVDALLRSVAADFRLTRHFSRPREALDAERRSAEERAGVPLPDLNRYGKRLEAHLTKHRDLAQSVVDFREKLGAGDVQIDQAFVDFLKNWVVDHILSEDRKYSPFLNDRGVY